MAEGKKQSTVGLSSKRITGLRDRSHSPWKGSPQDGSGPEWVEGMGSGPG